MAVTSFDIVKDNITEDCILLSAHNPLVFIVNANYTGGTPTVRATFKKDGVDFYTDLCIPTGDGAGYRTFAIISDNIVRSALPTYEDKLQLVETINEYDNFSQNYITVTFSEDGVIGGVEEAITFHAAHCARQFGESGALTDIVANDYNVVNSGVGGQAYLYYWSNAGAPASLTVEKFAGISIALAYVSGTGLQAIISKTVDTIPSIFTVTQGWIVDENMVVETSGGNFKVTSIDGGIKTIAYQIQLEYQGKVFTYTNSLVHDFNVNMSINSVVSGINATLSINNAPASPIVLYYDWGGDATYTNDTLATAASTVDSLGNHLIQCKLTAVYGSLSHIYHIQSVVNYHTLTYSLINSYNFASSPNLTLVSGETYLLQGSGTLNNGIGLIAKYTKAGSGTLTASKVASVLRFSSAHSNTSIIKLLIAFNELVEAGTYKLVMTIDSVTNTNSQVVYNHYDNISETATIASEDEYLSSGNPYTFVMPVEFNMTIGTTSSEINISKLELYKLI